MQRALISQGIWFVQGANRTPSTWLGAADSLEKIVFSQRPGALLLCMPVNKVLLIASCRSKAAGLSAPPYALSALFEVRRVIW